MQKKSGHRILIRNAKSIIDYLFLRSLRNQSQHYLTGKTQYISLLRQVIFYFQKPKDIKVFIVEINSKRVGYLLIRTSRQINYITEVIAPRWQNKGVGSEIIKFAQLRYNDLTAEILTTNLASVKLHQNNGFVLAATTEQLLIFEYHKNGPIF